MSPSQKKKNTGLLPYYFKKIGLVLIVLVIVSALIVKAMALPMLQASKASFRTIYLNGFILGLLFIAWAEDKTENETTIALRVKSMAFACTWAVLFVIMKPITDQIFKNPMEVESAQGLVLSMQFIYLIGYYLQRKSKR
jgi:membrane protease YdiL (CAAX protease family)